ncbi:hypothetical protein H0H93_011053 [Arthromyces matolae]|nr:hypothetical protein H0H93_011053 [Arthromyces matolae]
MEYTLPILQSFGSLDISSISSAEARVTAYTLLQEDRSALYRCLLSVNAQHNALSITCRAPVEILSRIFFWLVYMFNPEQSQKGPGPSLGWIPVAGVCKFWRDTALDYSLMWSFVFHRRTKWLTQVVLPRSKSFPLWISVNLDGPKTFTGIRKVLDEIYRIRGLSLVVDKTYSLDRVQKLLDSLSKTAPILEEFTVRIHPHARVVQLPSNLFADTSPKLTKLVLHRCIIPPTASALSTILHLELWCDTLSLSELFEFLRSTTHLKTLFITRTRKDFDINEEANLYSNTHTVVLAHLQFLTLFAEESSEMLPFLSIISYPAAIRLNITISSAEVHRRLIRALGIELDAWIDSICHLSIDTCTQSSANTLEAHQDRTSANHKSFKLSIRRPNVFQANKFLRYISLSNLESLRIHDEPKSTNILMQFGYLPALRTIEIICAPAGLTTWTRALLSGVSHDELMKEVVAGKDKWVNSVSYASVTSGLQRQETADIGQLRRLSLDALPTSMQFTSLKQLKFRGCDANGFYPNSIELVAIVHMRQVRGYPLEELCVENCVDYGANREAYFATARKFVQRISWDVKDGNQLQMENKKKREAQRRQEENKGKYLYPR